MAATQMKRPPCPKGHDGSPWPSPSYQNHLPTAVAEPPSVTELHRFSPGVPRNPETRYHPPMVTTLLTALVLGLFAGLAPGPYTTMVAGTALERGFRPALLLALTPLVTDLAPMLFSALLLERLGYAGLTALGIVGGAVILMVGVRFLRQNGGGKKPKITLSAPDEPDQSARITHVIVSSLMNPSPWFFWLVVASPFLLRAWNRSPGEGLVFVAVLFTANISSASGLAWIASHSRKVLNPAWQRRALQTVGATLVLVGTLLLWQASVGNFQQLVDQQEAIRSVVEDGLPPG